MTATPHPWSRSTAAQAAARRAEADAGPTIQHRDLPQTVERLEERLSRLEDFVRSYARCPCCTREDCCPPECDHASNAPSEAEVMELARRAMRGMAGH